MSKEDIQVADVNHALDRIFDTLSSTDPRHSERKARFRKYTGLLMAYMLQEVRKRVDHEC